MDFEDKECFNFDDAGYCDEWHTVYVEGDRIYRKTLVEDQESLTTYQFKIKGSDIILRCLECKHYRDDYNKDIMEDLLEYEVDEEGNDVTYRIKDGKPTKYWMDDIKAHVVAEDIPAIEEDFKGECEWHYMDEYIPVKAFIFTQVLDKEKANELIEKEIKNIEAVYKEADKLCKKYGTKWEPDDDNWREGSYGFDVKEKLSNEEAHKLYKELAELAEKYHMTYYDLTVGMNSIDRMHSLLRPQISSNITIS